MFFSNRVNIIDYISASGYQIYPENRDSNIVLTIIQFIIKVQTASNTYNLSRIDV